MYYYLQTINVINNTHKRYWISEYAPIRLKIHTFDEQKKIKNLIAEAFDLLDSINKL